MSDIDSVFEAVGNAKDLSGFTPRLAVGNHKLLLKRYGVKRSTKNKSKIIEADFVVVESNVHSPGEVRGWAWFPDTPGWAGEYESSRAKTFLQTVGDSIGDESPIAAIGSALASEAQFGMGIRIDVTITPQMDKAGNPRRNDKGEMYTNAQWVGVKQTLEDIQAGRAAVESNTPVVPAARAVAETLAQTAEAAPAPAPETQAAPAQAQAAAPKSSLLAALRK